MLEHFPIKVSFLADYPDFFSFVIVLILAALLAIGVKESSVMNNIFTTVNMITVAIVLIAGSFKVDPANWSISKDSIPVEAHGGDGGFLPFGVAGVMAGVRIL